MGLIAGTVGITNDYIWYVPANSSSEKDVTAAEVGYRWYSSWLMDPIFSSAGDYPRIMRERIASNSRAEGFAGSRLPSFTWNEIRDVRGSADFLGVNYFTQQIVKVLEPSNVVSYDNDAGVVSVELLPRVYIVYILLLYSFFFSRADFSLLFLLILRSLIRT